MPIDGVRRRFAGWFDGSLELALTGREAVWAVRSLSDGALVGSTRYLAIEPAHRRLEIGHTWYAPQVWAHPGQPGLQARPAALRVRDAGLQPRRAEDRQPQPALPGGDRQAGRDARRGVPRPHGPPRRLAAGLGLFLDRAGRVAGGARATRRRGWAPRRPQRRSSAMRQWTIDAFASEPFRGNPACVVEPFDAWPDDAAGCRRWPPRTTRPRPPSCCGPTIRPGSACAGSPRRSRCRSAATRRWPAPMRCSPSLGSPRRAVTFDTQSGPLTVAATGAGYRMDFPASMPRADRIRRRAWPRRWARAGGGVGRPYLVAILADEAAVRALAPDLARARADRRRRAGRARQRRRERSARPGAGYDVVSRFFAPGSGIPEDPATGSLHCILAPLFAAEAGPPAAALPPGLPGPRRRPRLRGEGRAGADRRPGGDGGREPAQGRVVRRAQAAAAAASPGSADHAAHGVVELGDLDRLGDVAVHAGGEVFLDLVRPWRWRSARRSGCARGRSRASAARIARVAARPSITGICMSIRIRSKSPRAPGLHRLRGRRRP